MEAPLASIPKSALHPYPALLLDEVVINVNSNSAYYLTPEYRCLKMVSERLGEWKADDPEKPRPDICDYVGPADGQEMEGGADPRSELRTVLDQH